AAGGGTSTPPRGGPGPGGRPRPPNPVRPPPPPHHPPPPAAAPAGRRKTPCAPAGPPAGAAARHPYGPGGGPPPPPRGGAPPRRPAGIRLLLRCEIERERRRGPGRRQRALHSARRLPDLLLRSAGRRSLRWRRPQLLSHDRQRFGQHAGRERRGIGQRLEHVAGRRGRSEVQGAVLRRRPLPVRRRQPPDCQRGSPVQDPLTSGVTRGACRAPSFPSGTGCPERSDASSR